MGHVELIVPSRPQLWSLASASFKFEHGTDYPASFAMSTLMSRLLSCIRASARVLNGLLPTKLVLPIALFDFF
jgi:hypothetical protein